MSNEISYRTVRLVQLHNSPALVGHIHTPRIQGYDRATVKRISDQIQKLLQVLVKNLNSENKT